MFQDEEKIVGFELARCEGVVTGGFAGVVQVVGVGAVLDEKVDQVRVVGNGGADQRSLPRVISGIYVSAVIEEEAGSLDPVPPLEDSEQSGAALGIGGVDVDASVNESAELVETAESGDVHEGRFAAVIDFCGTHVEEAGGKARLRPPA